MPTMIYLHSVSSCFLTSLQPPVVNRYAVLGSRLFHSNLSMLYHNVFFMMCRAHGIGFNMKVKTVTINLFTLMSLLCLVLFFTTYCSILND